MGSRVRLSPRVVRARVIDQIGRWGEASRNQLRQYCTQNVDLLDAVLAQLVADLVLETAMVPPFSSRSCREWIQVYRLRPARDDRRTAD
jgi:hypothetical protein